MSYILDALKKSEQERARRSAPSLRHAPTVVVAAERAPLWTYAVFAALLVVGGIAIGWLRPWQTDGRAPATTPVATPPVAPVAHEATSTVAIAPLSSSAQPMAPLGAQPPASLAALVPTPIAQATRPAAPAPSVSTAAPPPTIDQLAPAPTSVAPTLPAKPQAARAAPMPQTSDADMPKAAAAQASATRSLAALTQEKPQGKVRSLGAGPTPEEHLPALSDLPDEVRRDIPPFTLSVHFFSEQHERSLVSLNGVNLHEGDPIAPDFKLEKITPNGVVMNFKGTRFQYGAKSWSYK